MAPQFFNTLSNRVEEFTPLHDNEVRMYACGPTAFVDTRLGVLAARP